MPSTAFDASSLFATDHGAVERAGGGLRLTLGERSWRVTPDDLRALHDAVVPLAAQVYRCNCDCRWQVRREHGPTLVLGTDEVLRLHSLLDGAMAMLELNAVLDDAAIARPERS
jgi:hypothetical protein